MGVRELQGKPRQNLAELGHTVLATDCNIQNKDVRRKRCCNNICNTEVLEKRYITGQSLRTGAGGERRLGSWEQPCTLTYQLGISLITL